MGSIVNHPSGGRPKVVPGVRPAGRPSWLKRLCHRRTVAIVLGLLIAGLLGCRWYLSSSLAARQVAARLAALFGVPVRIDAIDVGWSDRTLLRGVVFREAEDHPEGSPWLAINEAAADVALLDWLGRGGTVRKIDVTGATFDLSFARDSHLLTRLPRPRRSAAAWPHLVLNDGRVILRQEGRDTPLDLQGLQAEVRGIEDHLELEGALRDPEWGRWDVDGTVHPDSKQVVLHLKTPSTPVDRLRLERLPFVSPKVWQHVQIAHGTTSVDLTLRFVLGTPGVRFRLELDLQDTELVVTSINLHADLACGRVVVENSRAELHDIKGRTASGRITTSGELDFRGQPARMQFSVDVHNLVLHQLPMTWKLPEQVSGELTGKATLQVQVADGKAKTSGAGKGEISRVVVGGIPMPRPVPLEMYTDGGRLRFRLPRGRFTGLMGGNPLQP